MKKEIIRFTKLFIGLFACALGCIIILKAAAICVFCYAGYNLFHIYTEYKKGIINGILKKGVCSS